ncbi:MAG TPA: class I adenylate-forming enzyme family protein [Acidithiobacillus sp.]|nr:class I adenylate-forming enzyme family protein [Acidithiobacillus sp.]
MIFLHQACLQRDRSESIALHLLGESTALSYGALDAASLTLALHLQAAGIGKGARIAVLAGLSAEFVVALLAVSRCGAAFSPIDTSLRGISLSSLMERLRPDAVITTEANVQRVFDVLGERFPVFVFAGRRLCAHEAALWGDWRQGAERMQWRLPFTLPDRAFASPMPPESMPDDDLLLMPTSGSTGQHKFVRLSHRALLFNTRAHVASFGIVGPFKALQILEVSYSYGLIASALGALVAGGSLVVPAHNTTRSVREAIETARPEICLGSPALFDRLIDNCSEEERVALRHLRKIGIGGDPCRAPLREKISAAFPEAEVFVTYGATEAGPRVSTLPAGQLLLRPDSVGLPLEGIAVEVVGPEGKPCPPGEEGVLRVRTPSRMNGYLFDDTPLEPDGWLTVGDLASLDDAGYLSIHGRMDCQIKHRGRRINPAQIEKVIECLAGVVWARVDVGNCMDRLRAVVFHRTGESSDFERQLVAHCRRNLPARLVPEEIALMPADGTYFFKGKPLSLTGSPSSFGEPD